MKRICLFAGFDKYNFIHDYVIYYLKELSEFAEIHYLADCDMPDKELMKLAPYAKTAQAYRHNKYDFGSWQELIHSLGWEYLEQFDELILANDSCFAPIFPFAEIFTKMESKNLDFWGNTINIYSYRHIQSYFIVFNNKIIKDADFRKFINGIHHEDERNEIVRKYEKRLTTLLENKGYKYDVYVPKNLVATHSSYKLLKARSPFFKIKNYTFPEAQSNPYLSIIKLKTLGYPIEYIFSCINKNYSHYLLIKNAFRCIKIYSINKPWEKTKRLIQKFKKTQTILITGGAGFIGSNLADTLLNYGYKVIVVDNFDDFYSRDIKQKNIVHNLKNKNYKLFKADIRNYKKIEKIFTKNKIDYVYHLAAKANVRKSFKNPEKYFETNVSGTENILKCFVKFNTKKFIAASSSSVYGVLDAEQFSEDAKNLNPISPYAESKLKMEKLVEKYTKEYNLNSVIIRPFTVYGPRQRPDLAICKFINKICKGEPINVYGDGSSLRDYTYITDLISALYSCISVDTGKFQIINIGTSEPINLKTMISVIEQCLGKNAIINYLPEQKGDVPKTYADTSKARQFFNYLPAVSFKNGIEKYIEYLNIEPNHP